MRVGLQTWGSEGDLRPFMALARGLKRAGHEVALAYTSVDGRDHSGPLAGTGVKLVRVAPRASVIATANDVLALLVQEPNPLRHIEMTLSALMDPIVDDLYEAAVELCSKTDLVVGHMLLHPLGAAAEKTGRTLMTLSPAHVAIPSREFAPLGAPASPRWLYPFWWWLGGLVIERVFGSRANALRRRVGLAPVHHLLNLMRDPPCLNLVAVSPVLCDRPSDWSQNHQLCGFFDLQDDVGWSMPAELDAFLRAGPPPVFLGLGSIMLVDPSPQSRERSVRLLVEAALGAGCRAIVQGCWAELPGLNVPPTIFRLERAPHAALFPHCAAVVHSGGAGTTHAAVRAGAPSVVVVHGNDQIAWARKLHRLGVAAPPLTRRNVTADKLTGAIRSVLSQPVMRDRALLLAGRMKGEDGVGRAIALIEAFGQNEPESPDAR